MRLDCESSRTRLRDVYERFGFEYHSDHTVRGVHVARYQLDCSDVDVSSMTTRKTALGADG